jgi:hypothetical protein
MNKIDFNINIFSLPTRTSSNDGQKQRFAVEFSEIYLGLDRRNLLYDGRHLDKFLVALEPN